MLCYNNCYLLRLRLKTLGQGSNPEVSVLNVVLRLAIRLKPKSFDLEYVIPAIDQATKLVCYSKSSMIDSLCVKMEIPLIGIPKNLP